VGHAFAYFWVIAFFVTNGAMLWLQVGALRRHQEMCFFLLTVATTCGLLYLLVTLILPRLMPPDTRQPWWYYPLTALLLLGQMILGVWGTARLFRMYGILHSTLKAERTNGRNA
jgi:hypothetical protein